MNFSSTLIEGAVGVEAAAAAAVLSVFGGGAFRLRPRGRAPRQEPKSGRELSVAAGVAGTDSLKTRKRREKGNDENDKIETGRKRP